MKTIKDLRVNDKVKILGKSIGDPIEYWSHNIGDICKITCIFNSSSYGNITTYELDHRPGDFLNTDLRKTGIDIL